MKLCSFVNISARHSKSYRGKKCSSRASKIAHQAKVFALKARQPGSLEPTLSCKERTEPTKLSSSLHLQAMVCVPPIPQQQQNNNNSNKNLKIFIVMT